MATEKTLLTIVNKILKPILLFTTETRIKIVNNTYSVALDKEWYSLADFIDSLRLSDKFLRARFLAGFDLATHMKSMKTDVFPNKPLCGCEYCKHTYYARLYRRECMNLNREVYKVTRERNRTDAESLDIHVNKERIWANINHINSMPVRLTTHPYVYALQQAKAARACKNKARKYARMAKALHRALNIPTNE